MTFVKLRLIQCHHFAKAPLPTLLTKTWNRFSHAPSCSCVFSCCSFTLRPESFFFVVACSKKDLLRKDLSPTVSLLILSWKSIGATSRFFFYSWLCSTSRSWSDRQQMQTVEQSGNDKQAKDSSSNSSSSSSSEAEEGTLCAVRCWFAFAWIRKLPWIGDMSHRNGALFI